MIKKGDRIVVYDVEYFLYIASHRTKGVCTKATKNIIWFKPDEPSKRDWVVHRKQCRKLRKKK